MMRVRELRVTYSPTPTRIEQPKINNVGPAVALFRPFLEHETQEVFMVALLDTKNRLIGVHTVSRGTLDCTMVHPRDVFKAAILANAATLITAHNHPSGNPTPSHDDMVIFQRLTEAGQLLGVAAVDHLIIGHHGQYFSVLGGLHGQ